MIAAEKLRVLHGDRIKLRPMKAADCEIVLAWRNQKRIRSTLEERTEPSPTIYQQTEWFKNSRSSRIDYILVMNDTEHPIGVWSLKKFHYGSFFKYLEQGRYIGDQNYLGMGLASEAADLWLDFAFNDLQAEAVVGVHRAENLRPQEINLSRGFEYLTVPDVSDEFVTMKIDRQTYFSKLELSGS